MQKLTKSKILRIIIIMLLVLITLFAVQEYTEYSVEAEIAQSGKCGDDITWTLDSEGTLTLSGSGDMYDYECENSQSTSPFYTLRNSIKEVVINQGITDIGDYSFYNCTELIKVTIGDDITIIGNGAFYNCTGLTRITIPDKVESIYAYAFKGCIGLTEIKLGDSVTYISFYAFHYCTGLREITIPDSVTSIGKYAFAGCTGISEIKIPDNVRSIDEGAFSACTGLNRVTATTNASYRYPPFDNCNNIEEVTFTGTGSVSSYICSNKTSIKTVTIGDSVTSIGGSAFHGCTGLKKITATTNVSYDHSGLGDCTNIEEVTFTGTGSVSSCICRGKTSIKTVTIGDSVTSIGGSAFYGCTGLTEITIGDSATSIGGSAFYGCTGLTEVPIGEGITNIGESAFYGCTGITEITIGDGVTNIGDYAFANCSEVCVLSIPNGVTRIGDYAFQNLTNLKKVTIPSTVEYLSGFNGCTEITSISIPDNVKTIGNYAFKDCGLIGVSIPNGVEAIGNYAFSSCEAIEKINLPESVTSIGNYCFSDLSKLSEVKLSENLSYIGTGAFSGCVELNNVNLPERLTSIGAEAFKGCNNLTYISIPNGVAKISDDIFNNCTNLACVSIGTGVKSIGYSAFENCSKLTTVVLPDGVTDIYGAAFRYCTSLEKVNFPESLIYIGDSAFRECNLKSIKLYDNLTEIGNYAFYNNYKLNKVQISGNTSVLYDNTFNGCFVSEVIFTGTCSGTIPVSLWQERSLRSIALPDGVTSIPKYCFYHCKWLQEINVPDGATTFNYLSFGMEYWDGSEKNLRIRIPDSINIIDDSAFRSQKISFDIFRESYADTAISSNKEYMSDLSVKQEMIEVIASQIDLKIGESVNVTDIIKTNDELIIDDIDIESSNEEVAFYGNGIIAAVAEGTATINIKYNNKVIQTNIVVSEIEPAIEDYEFVENNIKQTKCRYFFNKLKEIDKAFIDSEYRWISSDQSIATVDEDGVVKGLNNSTAVIRVCNDTTCLASYNVEFDNELIALYAYRDLDSTALGIGEEGRIRYYQYPYDNDDTNNVVFSSSNPEIATVDDNGNVLGISSGETTIALSKGDVTTQYVLEVEERPISSLSLNKSNVEANIGEMIQLTYSYLPLDTTDNYEWSSSNNDVAVVDNNGIVTVNGYGKATITLRYGNKEATCLVYCRKPMTDITINKIKTTIKCGQTEKLEIGYVPVDTTDERDVIWSSSNALVATVSDEGVVSANGVGTSLITAQVGSFVKFCSVTVEKGLPQYIVPTNISAHVGESLHNVELPEGFEWTDTDRVFDSTGSFTFKAKFTPKEEDKYNVVENIDITIKIENHSLKKVAAKEANCAETGNIEHWLCSGCGNHFSDSEGKNKMDDGSWIIDRTAHTLSKNEAHEPTCTEKGNSEYWCCSECEHYFGDSEGKTEIEENSWIISVKGHSLTKTEAVAPTCTEAGNSAYWTCSDCSKYFSDSEGKTEISENSWILKATGHDMTKTAQVKATFKKSGNTEYWYCSDCEKYFDDAKGENPIAERSWIVAQIDVDSIKLGKTEYTYDGNAKEPAVTVKDINGLALTSGADYTVTYTNNVNAGMATAKVTFTGNYSGSIEKNYEIKKATPSYEEPTSLKATYGDKLSSVKLPDNFSWVDGTQTVGNAGTNTFKAIYTPEDSDNYKIVKGIDVQIEVAKATVKAGAIDTLEAACNETLSQIALPNGYSWNDGTQSVGTASSDVKYFKATLKATDTVNYLDNTDVTVGIRVKHVDSKTEITKAASTTEAGTIHTYCEACNATLEEETIPQIAIHELAKTSVKYDGSEQKPAVTIKDSEGNALAEGKDYDLAYADNVNVGTASVTITYKGRYTGEETLNFAISSVKNVEAALSKTTYTYDGTAHTPEATVTSSVGTLVQGTDYDIAYSDNVNAGAAKAVITLKGNYSGTIEKTFEIEQADKSKVTASAASTATYCGSAIEPVVTVCGVNGTILTEGTDYELKYDDNIDVGTATVTIKLKGNYSGELNKNFSITQADGTSLAATLSDTSYVYDGTAKKPKAVITGLDGKTLTEGTDYSMSYSNNTNAGTATATITFKGNYSGSVEKTFTIKALSVGVELLQTSFKYKGKVIEPEFEIQASAGLTPVEGTDYTVTYSDNDTYGTGHVLVSFSGNYSGTIDKEFEIIRTYNLEGSVEGCSSKNEADVTITDESGNETKVTTADGKYSFNWIDGGDYIITVKGTGDFISREYTKTVDDDYTEETFEIRELGDVNCDGARSAEDITRLARHIAKISEESDSYKLKLFDTDRSSELDAADITHLARYVARIINTL